MPDRAILSSEPRWIVNERLMAREMAQDILNGSMVGVEFREVVSYVFFPLVAKHVQFGAVRLQNCPVWSYPIQTDGRILEKIRQPLPAAPQFLGDAVALGDLGPQSVVDLSQLSSPTLNTRL